MLTDTIEWLRFPLTVAVVYIHYCTSYVEFPETLGDHCYNSLVDGLSNHLTSIAVPLFFLFSGYLYFYNVKEWNREAYLSKTKLRVMSLLVPYVLWNLFFVFISLAALSWGAFQGLRVWSEIPEYLLSILPHFLWDTSTWSGGYAFFGLVEVSDHTGPIDLPLWYVRNLMIIVLASPLWYWMIKRFNRKFVILLLIAYVFGIWPQYHPISIMGISWFCLGAYLSLNQISLVSWAEGKTALLGFLYFAFCGISVYCDFNGLEQYSSMATPLSVLCGIPWIIRIVAKFIRRGILKPLPFLTASSFFIFAFHKTRIQQDVFFFLQGIMDHLLPSGSTLGMSILYLIWTPVTVGVILLLFLVLRKLIPGFVSLIVGGR